MSSTSARYIFVFVLAVNCILWSQSRYGHPMRSSMLHGESSLVRRISYELSNPGLALNLDEGFDQCRPLAFPLDSQCQHVQENCLPPNTFLPLNYLQEYFCTDIALRPLVCIGLLTWLIFLFSTLGISASDFFTPNLATIAQLLGLDENVAGVTFLAYGNGSPDVFSTFSAMRANSGSLAIGELLGAASFIVSCVVGAMCIIKPFQVERGPFLRDVGFFTVAVSVVLLILRDHHIHNWEAGVLIGLYVVYVFVVVVGNIYDRRQERKRQIEAVIRAEYQDDQVPIFDAPYTDNPNRQTLNIVSPIPSRTRAASTPAPPRLNTTLPPRPHSRTPSPANSPRHSQLPSFSLIGALEFRDVVASLQQQASSSSLSMFETPVTPYAGGHYHSHSRTRTPRTSSTSRDDERWNGSNGLPLDERSRSRPGFLSALSPRVEEEVDTAQSSHPNRNSGYFSSLNQEPTPVPSIFRTPASPTLSNSESTVQIFAPRSRRERFFEGLGRGIGHAFHVLFPTLHNLREQSILGKVACIFAAPAVTLLTLTLPVVVTPYECSHGSREKHYQGADGRLVDFEEEGVERVLIAEEEVEENLHELKFNKWLMATQCVFGPVFCVKVLFDGTKHEIWLLLAALISGLAAAILVAIFADNGKHPTFRMIRCSLGFFVAIVWIMAIADEVVNVLQTFGFIFGLSDAIIGLTIFAIGNSLADLVANMSVAVFAPIMGFSACFGGPMLNILIGIGVSGLYITTQTSQPYVLQLTRTLLVSSIGLLCLLAATLIYIPLNGYFLTRRWGILLIASYMTIMAINVVVELKS